MPVSKIVKKAASASDDFWRYLRATKTASPDTGRGYMMFVDKGKNPQQTSESLSRTYGPNLWEANPVDEIDAEDLKVLVKEEIDKNPYFLSSLGIDESQIDDFISEINPKDIVNSAEVYDSDAVYPIYEHILGPRDIRSIVTNDGLIVFDEAAVRPARLSLSALGLGAGASESLAYSNDLLGAAPKTPEWQASNAPPWMHSLGYRLLNVELPGQIKPFEGIGEYLVNTGYPDSFKTRLKRAVKAGADLL